MHLCHILRKLKHLSWQTEFKMVKENKRAETALKFPEINIIFRPIFEGLLFNFSI